MVFMPRIFNQKTVPKIASIVQEMCSPHILFVQKNVYLAFRIGTAEPRLVFATYDLCPGIQWQQLSLQQFIITSKTLLFERCQDHYISFLDQTSLKAYVG